MRLSVTAAACSTKKGRHCCHNFVALSFHAVVHSDASDGCEDGPPPRIPPNTGHSTLAEAEMNAASLRCRTLRRACV
ncbi:hypothetical protein DPMN_103955 [Dreissena polymorpha]|uniref:Uncharacterized protein n=1 Tax=Dreissena polymorpha TaxID=45954 RepID=A0A9D4H8U9_DREPO|nr:hypothetical protein DPMN_103955 [Dreissena polymorpha]